MSWFSRRREAPLAAVPSAAIFREIAVSICRTSRECSKHRDHPLIARAEYPPSCRGSSFDVSPDTFVTSRLAETVWDSARYGIIPLVLR